MTDTGQELRFEGTVVGQLADGRKRVKLDDSRCIHAELSARIKVRFTGIEEGARVACEISPYDDSKARIVERLE